MAIAWFGQAAIKIQLAAIKIQKWSSKKQTLFFVCEANVNSRLSEINAFLCSQIIKFIPTSSTHNKRRTNLNILESLGWRTPVNDPGLQFNTKC